MSVVEHVNGCPACTIDRYELLMTVRGTQIVRCAGCGLATWDWRGLDLQAFYDESYWRSTQTGKGYVDYFALADAMDSTHRKRLRWIHNLLLAQSVQQATPRLLDAGCGPGFFVKAAAEKGFQAAGVEVSAFAATFASEQLGQNVWHGQVRREDLRGGPYDVVTMWDVIEHLPDPADALAALATTLRSRGLIILSTGDRSTFAARLSGARWHLFTLPEHLWFFTRHSLTRLLARCGLNVVGYRYEVCWYPLRYLIERIEAVAGSRGVLSTRLGCFGRIRLPATLGDIVTVVARKA